MSLVVLKGVAPWRKKEEMKEPFPIPQHTLRWDLCKAFTRQQMSKYAGSTYLCGYLPQNVLSQSVYSPRVPSGKETRGRTPLAVQCIRIHLAVQETWVQSLGLE